ncbi:MAG: LysR family transcriptional regulator [Pseudomonadota bacterium]
MFQHLPPLKSLRAFEAAARLRSFTLAADELSLTQGAISYQIKSLETNLGVDLFARSARQVHLTDAGQKLFITSNRLLRELEDEIRLIAPGKNQSILTVSVSTFFVTRWLSSRLGKFLNEHPDVTIRLQHSVNDPDFSVQEVDLAISWDRVQADNQIGELLIPSPMIAVCAPALIDSGANRDRFDDLLQQTFLHDQKSNDGWRAWLEKAGLQHLGEGRGPVIVDPNVRVQSAIDGQGIVLANKLLQDEIDAGRLIEPFDVRLEGYGFHLIYNDAARHRHAVVLFSNWLRRQADEFNDENAR